MAEEIVKEILWSDNARKSFEAIISYLQSDWSQKEAESFVNRVSDMLSTLQRYPEMCRPSIKRKHVRIGILDKHTQIIYHYKTGKNQLEILLFWGMKQNPYKFKY